MKRDKSLDLVRCVACILIVVYHFLTCGMKEGRQACEGFNVQKYANNYPDLFNAFWFDLPSYYIHYLNNGLAEGRVAV